MRVLSVVRRVVCDEWSLRAAGGARLTVAALQHTSRASFEPHLAQPSRASGWCAAEAEGCDHVTCLRCVK